jgi:hypothetical protein
MGVNSGQYRTETTQLQFTEMKILRKVKRLKRMHAETAIFLDVTSWRSVPDIPATVIAILISGENLKTRSRTDGIGNE